MKTIIQRPIIHINSENLPSEIIADILGDPEEEHLEIYEGDTARMNDPIKIDVLRHYLDQLVQQGANYVSIDFHTDHQELELDGIHIGIASTEETLFHEQKDKDFQIQYCKTQIDNAARTKANFENKLKFLTGE